MDFLSVAYVSAATSDFRDEEIAELLLVSRRNNAREDITGALLHHGGRFVQIIEGPPQAVLRKFELIAADPRHRSVQKLRERATAARQFPEWTMGFRSGADDPLRQLVGFENFFGRRGRARVEHADNEAQQYLEWLSEYWLPGGRSS